MRWEVRPERSEAGKSRLQPGAAVKLIAAFANDRDRVCIAPDRARIFARPDKATSQSNSVGTGSAASGSSEFGFSWESALAMTLPGPAARFPSPRLNAALGDQLISQIPVRREVGNAPLRVLDRGKTLCIVDIGGFGRMGHGFKVARLGGWPTVLR
jgi:hypothetical protein